MSCFMYHTEEMENQDRKELGRVRGAEWMLATNLGDDVAVEMPVRSRVYHFPARDVSKLNSSRLIVEGGG